MVKTGDKKWGRWRAGRGIQGRKVTRKRDSDVRDKKRGDDKGRRKREGKVQEVFFCFFFLLRQAEISTNQIVACRPICPNRRCHGRMHIKSCLIG